MKSPIFIVIGIIFAPIAGILAFIISFDLMEQLGDLLGSPSLKSKTLFNKLI